MSPREPLLNVQHLRITYGRDVAVRDLSFSLETGKTMAIVGESGSGKSSVLRAILGLDERGTARQGRILLDGEDLLTMKPQERRRLCGPTIAMVFQDAGASFCAIRRIGIQIEESVRAHVPWTRAEILARAQLLMKRLDLPESIWDAYPFELSGGMGQRAGILSAMMLRPRLLLADEPTSALDVISQLRVIDALGEMREAEGTALLFVTHNIEVAQHVADSLLVMRHGDCVEMGSREAILSHPQQDYTRKLLQSVPHLDAGVSSLSGKEGVR